MADRTGEAHPSISAQPLAPVVQRGRQLPINNLKRRRAKQSIAIILLDFRKNGNARCPSAPKAPHTLLRTRRLLRRRPILPLVLPPPPELRQGQSPHQNNRQASERESPLHRGTVPQRAIQTGMRQEYRRGTDTGGVRHAEEYEREEDRQVGRAGGEGGLRQCSGRLDADAESGTRDF
jgi:hypothetical protein